MKNICLLVFLFLLCNRSLSQLDEENANVNKYAITEIKISAEKKEDPIQLPVSDIHVYDSRFDTSCLGINIKKSSITLNLLDFKYDVAKEIKNYYSSIINSDPSVNFGELHCFIKKLILSDFIYVDNTEDERLVSKKYDANKMSGLLFIAEFYISHNNLFTPLYRYDTTLTGPYPISTYGGNYITEALQLSISKATKLKWSNILDHGKKLKWEDIIQFNKKKFVVPVLTQKPMRGLYLNFEDFLNNKPSLDSFTLEKHKTGDYLYIKNEKGQDMLVTDLWGYSDGEDFYIFSANNYFKLQRTGNGFKTFGAKDFTGKRVMRWNFRPIDLMTPNSNFSKDRTRQKYYLIKNYFLLDMDTGELY